MTLISLWELAPAHAPADYRAILTELAAVDARSLTHAVDCVAAAIKGQGFDDPEQILEAYAIKVHEWTRAEDAVAMAAAALETVLMLADRYR